MDFIKKHIFKITIILIILFLFKSCQSCSRKRDCADIQVKYDSIQAKIIDDSLMYSDSIRGLKLHIQGMEADRKHDSSVIALLEGNIIDLKDDKKKLNSSNYSLIKKINTENAK